MALSGDRTGWDLARDSAEAYAGVQRVTLRKFQNELKIALPKFHLNDLDFEVVTDDIAGLLIGKLSFTWMGHEEPESSYTENHYETYLTETAPVTWWDHAKLALVNRWPLLKPRLYINMREIVVHVHRTNQIRKTVTRVCPHLNTDTMSNRGEHISWAVRNERNPYA